MKLPIKAKGETVTYEGHGLVHEVEDLYAQRTCWTWCNLRFDVDDLDSRRNPVTCLWCVARVHPEIFD